MIEQPTITSYERWAEAARRARINIIRMTSTAKSGHPGPAFSIVEIMVALYLAEMRIDPERSNLPDRDRFVLSKGHAAPALYAMLYETGFISEAAMLSLRQLGSPLQGHPSAKMDGVDATSGSLGTGLSQAVGMALGAKIGCAPYRVFAVVGDGECDEGQIWEAALSASHFHLDNLVVFVDHNQDQFEGTVSEVMTLAPLADKWKAFGWRVEEINGHSFYEISGFLERSKSCRNIPSVAVAHTVKGFGVSFMHGNHAYHARSLTGEETARAIRELELQARTNTSYGVDG